MDVGTEIPAEQYTNSGTKQHVLSRTDEAYKVKPINDFQFPRFYFIIPQFRALHSDGLPYLYTLPSNTVFSNEV